MGGAPVLGVSREAQAHPSVAFQGRSAFTPSTGDKLTFVHLTFSVGFFFYLVLLSNCERI